MQLRLQRVAACSCGCRGWSHAAAAAADIVFEFSFLYAVLHEARHYCILHCLHM